MLDCIVFGYLSKFFISEWFICEEFFKWKWVLYVCLFKVCFELNLDFFLMLNFGIEVKDVFIRLLLRLGVRCCVCECYDVKFLWLILEK